eukprot:48135-Chlamydomonas_euryale.AAC.1
MVGDAGGRFVVRVMAHGPVGKAVQALTAREFNLGCGIILVGFKMELLARDLQILLMSTKGAFVEVGKSSAAQQDGAASMYRANHPGNDMTGWFHSLFKLPPLREASYAILGRP